MLLDGAVGIQNVYVLNEHFNNLKYAKFNNLEYTYTAVPKALRKWGCISTFFLIFW